jgi:hypothetical protein
MKNNFLRRYLLRIPFRINSSVFPLRMTRPSHLRDVLQNFTSHQVLNHSYRSTQS